MNDANAPFTKIKIHYWIKWALIYFLLTALFGMLLRMAHIYSYPDWFEFKNIRHAHSHMGMMGWLFCGLFVCIVHFFGLTSTRYAKLFWLFQVSIIGMAISFPIQGYGVMSILFTTTHLLLSYVFIYFSSRDVFADKSKGHGASRLLLFTSFGFLLLSTIGIWAVGLLMNTSLDKSIWYYNSVQFFLHFQFNGWFIFSALALFFKILENYKLEIDRRRFRHFYILLVISCFLTFALAVTWSTPHYLIFIVNSVGCIIQFFALIALFKILKIHRLAINRILSAWVYKLMTFSIACFAIKIISQTLVAIPALAITSYTIRNFVVGFIHLILLAMISTFILGLISHIFKITTRLQKIGTIILCTGIVLTELIIFIQGFLLWIKFGYMSYYHEILFAFSAVIPIGVFMYIMGYWRKRTLSPIIDKNSKGN